MRRKGRVRTREKRGVKEEARQGKEYAILYGATTLCLFIISLAYESKTEPVGFMLAFAYCPLHLLAKSGRDSYLGKIRGLGLLE